MKVLKDPNVISQENKGTCAQTSIERAIAETNKTQYIDLLIQFLTKGYYQKNSNSPKIELNTGGIINNPDIEGNDKRLLTTRIITPSFMDHADQKTFNDTYNDDTDRTEKKGFDGSLSEPTLEAVTSKEYTTSYIGNLDNSAKLTLLKKILEEYPGYPVIINLQQTYGGPHAVRLLDISEDKIVISNPWGSIETYEIDSQQYLQDISYVSFPTSLKFRILEMLLLAKTKLLP